MGEGLLPRASPNLRVVSKGCRPLFVGYLVFLITISSGLGEKTKLVVPVTLRISKNPCL